MDTKTVGLIFRYNKHVVGLNTGGISDEESKKTFPENISTVNWIVGHLIFTRAEILKMLGKETAYPELDGTAYDRGSAPDKDKSLPLDKLMELLTKSQDDLNAALLDEEKENKLDQKAYESLVFLSFHEAYHVGQLGVIRKLLGKESAIK